jgi:hypothetical protein
MQNVLMLKWVVHIVTTVLERANSNFSQGEVGIFLAAKEEASVEVSAGPVNEY